MNSYFSKILNNVKEKAVRTLVKIRYGENSDIVFVSRNKNNVLDFNTELLSDSANTLAEARTKLAQNLLLRYGAYTLIKKPFTFCLYLKKNYFQDLREIDKYMKEIIQWRGKTTLNNRAIGIIYKYL
jgi:isocitrate/isopropylmalate dehydrogenase